IRTIFTILLFLLFYVAKDGLLFAQEKPDADRKAEPKPAKAAKKGIEQAGISPSFDLNEELVRLKLLELNFTRELGRVKVEHPLTEKAWASEKSALEGAEKIKPGQVEKVDARWAKGLFLEARRDSLETRLENLDKLRKIFTWHDTLGTTKIPQMQLFAWRKEVKSFQVGLKSHQRLAKNKIAELQTEITALKTAIADNKLSWSEKHWLKQKFSYLKQTLLVYERLLLELQQEAQVAVDFLRSLKLKVSLITPFDRIKEIFSRIMGIWRVELTRVDAQPITIGKILLVFVFFFLGILLSRFLSLFVTNSLLSKLPLEIGSLDAVQKLLFYTMVVVFSLLALRIIQIPLTFLTFFGGALALGVGFGSQNIVNNFISGLIILTELPIKVGDFIEIDGGIGTVERIGLRSTTVLTPDNIFLIIPNSYFLEKRIINWTHHNKEIRAKITVGVAYGSPLSKVRNLIMEAFKTHGLVLDEPKPYVFLNEFADNAIVFESYFFINVHNLISRRTIQSDVRFIIASLFEKADITIAFPQRDLHLDFATPLDINWKKDIATPEKNEETTGSTEQ
ncbi:mechanosensitive ion channel family protein, partial [Candidatus Riflebacteria bacterium]